MTWFAKWLATFGIVVLEYEVLSLIGLSAFINAIGGVSLILLFIVGYWVNQWILRRKGYDEPTSEFYAWIDVFALTKPNRMSS
jgi:hypothetical protein